MPRLLIAHRLETECYTIRSWHRRRDFLKKNAEFSFPQRRENRTISEVKRFTFCFLCFSHIYFQFINCLWFPWRKIWRRFYVWKCYILGRDCNYASQQKHCNTFRWMRHAVVSNLMSTLFSKSANLIVPFSLSRWRFFIVHRKGSLKSADIKCKRCYGVMNKGDRLRNF